MSIPPLTKLDEKKKNLMFCPVLGEWRLDNCWIISIWPLLRRLSVLDRGNSLDTQLGACDSQWLDSKYYCMLGITTNIKCFDTGLLVTA